MTKTSEKRRGSGLAQRLRANIDRKESDARSREDNRLRALQDARRERQELMVDLGSFAEDVGFFVEREDDSLMFRRSDVWIQFDASSDDGKVAVVLGERRPVRYALVFEPGLKKWVLNIRRKNGADERLILFDAGLEHLVCNVFDLEAAAEADLPADR
ncbi:MAG: hypothetical protein ACI9MC_002626 [Kiritimatiellia bacterium]|jgi:hypothetical protein